MNRRTYFKKIALITGGIIIAPHLLVSCYDGASVSYASSFKQQPFAALDEIRHFIRLSPGHLALEMQRNIESKDAEAIFNFINTRIATIPSLSNRIDDGSTMTRWGQAGMLRCGKGSLREKSDLLFLMLKEAGFNPQYYRTNYSVNKEKLQAIFCNVSEENDIVPIPEKELKMFDESLKKSSNNSESPLVSLENAQQNAKILQEKILNAIPKNYEADISEFTWLETTEIMAPFVRINLGEETKDLNFVEGLDFSEIKKIDSNASTNPLKFEDKDKLHKNIRIKLNLTYNENIDQEIPLVAGVWDYQDIVGKQVIMQFMPTVPTEQYLQTPIEQINQFMPALTLRDPGAAIEELQKKSFTETGFDFFGNTFSEVRGGGIAINGNTLDDINPKQTEKIASIKAIVSAESYPKIQIRIAPLDSNGNLIRQLSASSFSVSDQEQSVQMSVVQNTLSPSVLIMYDVTSSMPIEYYAYGVPEEIKKKITAGLQPEFASQRYKYMPFDTDLSTTIKNLAVNEFDHIIFLGDGGEFKNVNLEAFKEQFKNVSASYHFIPNIYKEHTIDKSEATPFFNTKERTIHHIDSLEADVKEVGQKLKTSDLYPYVFEYNSPSDNDQVIHDVIIGVTNTNNVTPVSLRYVMNREKEYAAAKTPVGLWMELEWETDNNTKTHRSHLAGYNYIQDEAILPKHERELKQFLLGSHYVFFEADKATMPVLLDDLVTAKLSAAPIAESPQNDIKKSIEQLNQTEPLPGMASSAFAPILDPVGTNRITFENGFQSCLYSEYLDFENNASVRKINMLPTSDIRTLAPTKSEAFAKTLEQTCLLAISEGALFTKSTYSDLASASIKHYSGYGDLDFNEHPGLQQVKDKSYLNHILYDGTFASDSFWKINKETGALLGILPDGSGGGSSSAQFVENLIQEIKTIIEAYNKLSEQITKAGGVACNIVAIHGQLLIRLYGQVSVVLATMNSGGLNAKAMQAVKGAAYQSLKTIAYGKWSKLEKLDKLIDKLLDPGWPEIEA